MAASKPSVCRITAAPVLPHRHEFKRDPVRQARMRYMIPGGFKHGGGCVEPEKLRAGIAMRNGDEIARRAASDFDKASAGLKVQFADQAVTADQIITAREIVEIPLAPIDAIHECAVRIRLALHFAVTSAVAGNTHGAAIDR